MTHQNTEFGFVSHQLEALIVQALVYFAKKQKSKTLSLYGRIVGDRIFCSAEN